MLIAADAIATGRELLRPGWIEIVDTLVADVGAGAAPRDVDVRATTIVPGFVDSHVHGGGGGSFSTAVPRETQAAVDWHRHRGTTTMVASLVSAEPAELLREVTGLVESVHSGLLAGIHLEGPWLATTRCGAHDPEVLRDPTTAELDALLEAGDGTIRMLTLAPERDGALTAIERIVDAGVVAAVGHTEATYRQTRAALDAGATVGTHLFNAMRGIHHREPGPVIALLEDPRTTVEVIADGVHVDPALYRHVSTVAGADRVSLVTDAIAAAGMADGRYLLGPVGVDVVDGVARVAGHETIAGSTASMDALFRFAVRHCGLPADQALRTAVAQTSINPSRTLGLPADGLVPGAAADLVLLDAEFAVTDVLHRGSWVRGVDQS